LCRELVAHGHAVVAFDRVPVEGPGTAAVVTGDITDAADIEAVVSAHRVDGCVHLAGVASVAGCQRHPEMALAVNVLGTMHLLDAIRQHVPDAHVVMVSSAHVYGNIRPDYALREDQPLRPSNVYTVSKAAADLAASGYAQQFGMSIAVARPSNHIGPGQAMDFVVPAFAKQVHDIACGTCEPVLRVGNLDSVRDFSDVRDVVAAYRLLLEKGRAGEPYNISSGKHIRIGEVLDRLCRLAGVTPRIIVDPEKFRPTDAAPVLDTAKLRNDTGWCPKFSLDDTFRDILAGVS
jgi:GDP-4-dehydro-6-deoxy-D-mannose reductase